jgi:hypothetical protein
MTPKEKLFLKNVKDFEKSIDWLERALKKSETVDVDRLSEEDIEKIEVLFSRFSRSTDMLINRVLRGIDLLELEDIGTKLDVVIRAEKRGFVESFRELIALKDLRNELAYEYLGEWFVNKLPEVVEASKRLIEIANRVLNYVYEELTPKIED